MVAGESDSTKCSSYETRRGFRGRCRRKRVAKVPVIPGMQFTLNRDV